MEEALEACRQAWTRFAAPRPAALRNLAGWCLYRRHLQPHLDNSKAEVEDAGRVASRLRPQVMEEALRAAQRICDLTLQEPGSPYTRSILKLAQMLKQGQRWPELEQWTAKLDPALLSATPVQLRAVGRKSSRTMASELESWLALRARALLELGRYEECIAVCQQYEQAISQPHYDWDVWVPYYEAQALAKLGRFEEAEAVLDRILPKNRASWLLRFRAQLYAEAGDADRAWQTALDAALELVHPEKDPRLLEILAGMAQKRGDGKAARQHLELLLAVRQAAGWGIEKLRRRADAVGVVIGKDTDPSSRRRQFQALRRWWWQQLEAVEPRSRGTVERLLGRGGFLRSDEGLSLYFLADELRHAEPGQRVDFWVRPNWDAKKQRVAPRAIRLRPLDSEQPKT